MRLQLVMFHNRFRAGSRTEPNRREPKHSDTTRTEPNIKTNRTKPNRSEPKPLWHEPNRTDTTAEPVWTDPLRTDTV